LLVAAIARDEDAYRRILHRRAKPVLIAVNVVASLFVMFHAVTWFNLAPRAMILKPRGRRVPPPLVAMAR
jgi:fumarate reductase subunit C